MSMMLIDQTKDSACKTAEADAIRSKTGGSASLAYDWANNKGFADAIAAIPSGGGDETISFLDWGNYTITTGGSFSSSNTRIVAKHMLYKCKSISIPTGYEIVIPAATIPEITTSVAANGGRFVGFWTGTGYTNSFTWFNSQTIDLTEIEGWDEYYFIMLLRKTNNTNISPSEGNAVVVTYNPSDGAFVN